MDKDFKIKYHAFVYAYYTSRKICLNGMMKRKYNEKFFFFVVKDKILIEIEKNDAGERQFIFTNLAKELIS